MVEAYGISFQRRHGRDNGLDFNRQCALNSLRNLMSRAKRERKLILHARDSAFCRT